MSDPTIEAEALALGWSPLDQWRGDPASWVDAEAFVERGHTVMPILRKNNQELVGKLTSTQSELAQVKVALAETAESVKALTEFQAAEVKRQVEAQVSAIRAQLREARRDNDDDLVDSLEAKLDEAKEKLREPPPSPTAKPTTTTPPLEAWAIAFAEENASWFGPDKKRTALVMAACEDLKETTSLRGAELLSRAKAEMEAIFGGAPQISKSEGGSRGGGESPSSSGGKSYASLPPEAKEIVRSQERMMVGKGKPFKDTAAWQKHYAEVYFGS